MATEPVLSADAGIVIDADTGTVVWSKSPAAQLRQASTTKVMTMLLAVEYDPTLDDQITISSTADLTGGSTASVSEGEVYAALDLAYGLMLPSGNDAAVAFAEHIGMTYLGAADAAAGVTAFVARMNARAAELGLVNTAYANPHGMDDTDHYSSAEDLAKLARVAFDIPLIRQIASTPSYIGVPVSNPNGSPNGWSNTNVLLGAYQVVCGKTGTTAGAGACLTTLYEVGGRRWISALLGAPDGAGRVDDSIAMLEYARELAGVAGTLSGVSTANHARSHNWSTTGYFPDLYIDGHGLFSQTTGEQLTYLFWGTSVAVVAPRSTSRGIMEVTLDGAPPVDVDLYAAAAEKGVTVYERTGLGDGPHTLVFTVSGRQNPASSGIMVALDEFHVTRAMAGAGAASGVVYDWEISPSGEESWSPFLTGSAAPRTPSPSVSPGLYDFRHRPRYLEAGVDVEARAWTVVKAVEVVAADGSDGGVTRSMLFSEESMKPMSASGSEKERTVYFDAFTAAFEPEDGLAGPAMISINGAPAVPSVNSVAPAPGGSRYKLVIAASELASPHDQVDVQPFATAEIISGGHAVAVEYDPARAPQTIPMDAEGNVRSGLAGASQSDLVAARVAAEAAALEAAALEGQVGSGFTSVTNQVGNVQDSVAELSTTGVSVDLSAVNARLDEVLSEARQSSEWEREPNSIYGYLYPLGADKQRNGTRRRITYASATSSTPVRIEPPEAY